MCLRGDLMNNKNLVLEEIRNEIMSDLDNRDFTQKGWLPIYRTSAQSKIMIIGQAPGLKAQTTQTIWNDLSGNNLRQWLGVTKEQFYNTDNFALVPMDFYFPGKGKSGDLPPRKEFSNKWHAKLISNLDELKLIILIGNYSQKHYLKSSAKKNLTETIKSYKEYLPQYFPLVHPSPINFRWHKLNPWFMEEIVPDLQKIVKHILNT